MERSAYHRFNLMPNAVRNRKPNARKLPGASLLAQLASCMGKSNVSIVSIVNDGNFHDIFTFSETVVSDTGIMEIKYVDQNANVLTDTMTQTGATTFSHDQNNQVRVGWVSNANGATGEGGGPVIGNAVQP